MGRKMGKLQEAEPLHQQSLTIQKKVLGEEHPDVAASLNNLANLLQRMGKLQEAEPLYKESLAIFKKVLWSEHPLVVMSLFNVAMLLQAMGKLQEALSMMQEALASWDRCDEIVQQSILPMCYSDPVAKRQPLKYLFENMGR